MVDDLFEIAAPADGETPPELILRLHVQPGAGRTAIMGRHGNALKVKVAAPPTGGRANAACVALVAETTGVGADAVELSGGAASRDKRVRIRGLAVEDLRRALTIALEEGNAGGRRGVPPAAH